MHTALQAIKRFCRQGSRPNSSIPLFTIFYGHRRSISLFLSDKVWLGAFVFPYSPRH